jgi:hypothetical protein
MLDLVATKINDLGVSIADYPMAAPAIMPHFMLILN